jgi:hypothetical protein
MVEYGKLEKFGEQPEDIPSQFPEEKNVQM